MEGLRCEELRLDADKNAAPHGLITVSAKHIDIDSRSTKD